LTSSRKPMLSRAWDSSINEKCLVLIEHSVPPRGRGGLSASFTRARR